MNFYIGHKTLRFAIFHYSLVIPLYLLNGLDLHQIALIESLYIVVFTCFLIPSGYVVDAIGAKNCLIVGTVLIGATDLLLYTSKSFEDFFIILFIDALSQALCNSADSISMRLILANNYSSDRFLQIESISWVYRNLALGSSSVLGGILASFSSIKAALLASTTMVILSLVCACAASIPKSVRPSLVNIKRESILHKRRRIFTDLKNTFSTVQKLSKRNLSLSVYFYSIDAIGYIIIPIVLNQHKAEYWLYGSAFAVVVATSALSHIAIMKNSKIFLGSNLYTSFTFLYFLILLLGFELDKKIALPSAFFAFSMYGLVKGWYYPSTKASLMDEIVTVGIGKAFSLILFISNFFASALIYCFLSLTNHYSLPTALFLFFILTLGASLTFALHKPDPLFSEKSR